MKNTTDDFCILQTIETFKEITITRTEPPKSFGISEMHSVLKKAIVCLTETKHLSNDDLKIEKWVRLSGEYSKQNAANAVKAVTSIINACFNQERIVFVLTRKIAQKLLKEDKNWIGQNGFGNDKYREVLKLICGIVKRVELPSSRKHPPGVFEIVHPEFLKYLPQVRDEQIAEARSFLNGDHTQDQEVRSKELEDSSKRLEDRIMPYRPVQSLQGERHGGKDNGGIIASTGRDHIERITKLLATPGLNSKSIKMLGNWKNNFPNGLSTAQLGTLDQIEQKCFLIHPEAGSPVDATDAYCMLSDFVRDNWTLGEQKIRENFSAKVGATVARIAFRAADASGGPDLQWMIGYFSEFGKPKKPEAIYVTRRFSAYDHEQAITDVDGGNEK